jgi:hypothetical protein
LDSEGHHVARKVLLMTHVCRPGRGSVVTYLNPRVSGPAFIRAVAKDSPVADPGTNELWVPVLCPDRTVELLDPRLIVDATPVDSPELRSA